MSLNFLFLDMNAYFASCEQQLRPELRNKPVVIAPMDTDSTCCIAASYEAKGFGIKTGTGIREARRMCPGLIVVEGRPELYVRLHHQIVEAVESCLHVDAIHSIDEMSCKLMGPERELDQAVRLAQKVKNTVYERVGQSLRCSVGLAPNRFLAKVASDMQKPDGLTIIRKEELPHKLYSLKLDDLPGIAKRMTRRLNKAGIFTVAQLCGQAEERMREIWQSLLGTVWYHNLRGDSLPELPVHKRQVGHTRVLAPKFRTLPLAHDILIRLTHKAAARLRHYRYWAQQLSVFVRFLDGGSWQDQTHLGPSQDTTTIVEAINRLWPTCPTHHKPLQVGMALFDLVAEASATIPLMESDQKRTRLWQAVDQINRRYGTMAAFLGGAIHVQEMAPVKIAFSQIPDLDLKA
ncbi:MAG: Protein UmuC [Phycisphaerae bacterium]|nr:Protein UmuC [Phycisphaerae bacterium]